jgi:hypothetical protein
MAMVLARREPATRRDWVRFMIQYYGFRIEAEKVDINNQIYREE